MKSPRYMSCAFVIISTALMSMPAVGSTGARTDIGTLSPFSERTLSLDAQLGSGAPLGVAGMILQYTPVPMLMLQVGMGVSGCGLRGGFAIGPRFVVGNHFAVDVSIGYAAGDHRAGDNITNLGGLTRSLKVAKQDPVGTTHMFSATLEARYRSSSGVQIGLLVGLSSIMNRADFSGEDVGRLSPFVGATVGYAFAL